MNFEYCRKNLTIIPVDLDEQLEILRIWNNPLLQKISNLNKMINLKSLFLDCNNITKIENLDTLINLERLSLAMNKITRIENLSKLTNLWFLNLATNPITKIANLVNQTKLTKLSVGVCPIEGPINTLEKYTEYIKKVKIPLELKWNDYFMIIAIINNKYIDIYRIYTY
jgi:Leucine rich repeat